MRLGHHSDVYEKQIISNLRDRFSLPPSLKIWLGHGLAHSVAELTRGLYSFMSHRPGLAVQTDVNFEFVESLPYFQREGFSVFQMLSKDIHEKAIDLTKISKNTLFSLLSEDDAFLCRKTDLTDLHQHCESQKVYTIQVLHSAFALKKTIEVAPYTALVLNLSSDLSAIVFGERVKIERLHFGHDFFTHHHLETINQCLSYVVEDKSKIVDFENSFSNLTNNLRNFHKNWWWDRAILSFKEIDSSALVDIYKLQYNNQSNLIPLSRCVWDQKTTLWLEKMGLHEDTIQKTVLIPIEEIGTHLAERLVGCYEEVLKLQSGI